MGGMIPWVAEISAGNAGKSDGSDGNLKKKKHQIHFFEVQFADGLNWHERWKLPDFIGIFHLNFIISMKPSWTLSGASNNYGSLGGLPCGIFMMVKPAH